MERRNHLYRKFTFTWIIENFFEDSKRVIGKKIVSPSFFIETYDDSEWLAELYFNGHGDGMNCFLGKKETSFVRFQDNERNFELEVIDKYGRVCYFKQFLETSMKDIPNGHLVSTKAILGMDRLMTGMEITTFTVRWHILTKDIVSTPPKECIAKTRFDVERCSFDWKVKCRDRTLRRCFRIRGQMYEVSLDMCDNDCGIRILNSRNPFNTLGCKFTLLDTLGLKLTTKTATYIFSKGNDILQLPDFVDKEMLLINQSTCLQSGIFTLLCEFCAPTGSFTSAVEYKFTNINPAPLSMQPCTLREDLQKMYADKVFTDLKFRIGNKRLFAHKSVLSVRSPVFHAMFNQDMTENQTGVVDITDTNLNTFDDFLKYFYTDTVEDMDVEKAMELMILADKYQVTGLSTTCSVFLASSITENSVLKLFVTADAVEDRYLKESAFRFIKTRAGNILNSAQWKTFLSENIRLASEIVTQLATDLSEYYGSTW